MNSRKTPVPPKAVPHHVPVHEFPVVGIGASAGGLAAFEAFFSGMPADRNPGMAFVLVQHLAPDHESILTELIRRCTRMEVLQITNGVTVKPDCVYIIPPNHNLAFMHGCLYLTNPEQPHGRRLPIDFFFRSLALDLGDRAICIVLSGTGSDGSDGALAIKAAGGLVMAQTPGSTDYDGMPRSVIATGCVDYQLIPQEMASQLLVYASRAFIRHPHAAVQPSPDAEQDLTKIFLLLRDRTGHDFSQYKPSTIQRRLERRLVIHQIGNIRDYVKFLQVTPLEVEALFRDLLIGVTCFFRDAEPFQALKELVLPRLLAEKAPDAAIRIWIPGCSTGEEAYSLAILLREQLDELRQNQTIQLFATDIDSRAIATARNGRYSATSTADLGDYRLSRFFHLDPQDDHYRINKEIRDMVIFSEQNLIKDPPFSRLDLICCRNLLIYMAGELQKRIIPLFHYALKPGGFLFLGTAETVGEHSELFVPLDRKAKLYQRKNDEQGKAAGHQVLPLPGAATRAGKRQPANHPNPAPRLSYREMAEQALLNHLAPIAAVVNAQGEILYIHGRTGRYLEPTPGETGTSNILAMARDGLKQVLSPLLFRSAWTSETLTARSAPVPGMDGTPGVKVTVTPFPIDPDHQTVGPLFLIILEDSDGSPSRNTAVATDTQDTSGDAASQPEDAETRLIALQQEVRAKDEFIQTTQEELETTNEELRSSNEEMQSINEELQSTNEELETSKEELQSVNEELSTVNAELLTKLADLSRANNDMNNLLAGTGIGTIFVDLQLRVMRFTPTATLVINLIPSDIGRPIAHIVSNLVAYETLVPDIQSVLDTLVPKEIEVRTRTPKRYTLRILPYRTLENLVEGAVVTFFEKTEVLPDSITV